MDELEKDLTSEEISTMQNESRAILCPLNFKDELLKLEVGNGCSSIPLEDYKLTDDELRFLEEKIIEQMRIAISDQDLRLDLNGMVWDWIRELDNQEVVTVFSARGHEWELTHGRFNTMVRWLNPQRDRDGRQRYYNADMSTKPNHIGVQACAETQIPMNPEEALDWARDLDDGFLNFFGIPILDSASKS